MVIVIMQFITSLNQLWGDGARLTIHSELQLEEYPSYMILVIPTLSHVHWNFETIFSCLLKYCFPSRLHECREYLFRRTSP